MDKWIELVKAKMSELKITQTELGERVGMSQGGIGHWLNKRREPGITEMNRVLQALGMDFLEVVLVIREPQIDAATMRCRWRRSTTRTSVTRSVTGTRRARCVRAGDPPMASRQAAFRTDGLSRPRRGVLVDGDGGFDDRAAAARALPKAC